MDSLGDLDSLNIPSVICGTCGTPVRADGELQETSTTDECPDCSTYWIKEQVLRYFR